MTLVCPLGFDSQALAPLGDRLLVFNADRGGATETIDRNLAGLPSASKVTLSDYGYPNNYADIGVEQGERMRAAMLDFLARVDASSDLPNTSPSAQEGEVDDIYFRVQGSGPPLVLLPLGAAPAQWDPVVSAFTERYCVITLTGPVLGMVGSLEGRGPHPRLPVRRGQPDRRCADPARRKGAGGPVAEPACSAVGWPAARTGRTRWPAWTSTPTSWREAADIARREGMEDVVSFHEGSAEALPFDDDSFDVVFSSTVIQRVNADLMLPELVRVVKPGGRIAVLGHAHDMNRWVNLPLRLDLKTRIESPPWVDDPGHPQGCDDSSLYQRFAGLGLQNTRMFPFISTFAEPDRLQFMQGGILPTLNAEEAAEWRAAAEQAQSDGTFFISTPFHCAVGTKH